MVREDFRRASTTWSWGSSRHGNAMLRCDGTAMRRHNGVTMRQRDGAVPSRLLRPCHSERSSTEWSGVPPSCHFDRSEAERRNPAGATREPLSQLACRRDAGSRACELDIVSRRFLDFAHLRCAPLEMTWEKGHYDRTGPGSK